MKEGLNNTANTNGGTDRQTLTLLSGNGDQHQFSPNDIHNLSRNQVMRINKMINNEKSLDLLSNSLNTFFKEMYRDQFGEFVCGYWGLKG